MFALQISSYELTKNNWLLLEVIVNNFSEIVDGYIATATWRDGSFYAPIGDSANLMWKEKNTINEWQEKVNDVPVWPKFEEEDDAYWVAVAPINPVITDGKQKVMFVTKKSGMTTNASKASKKIADKTSYETPDASDDEVRLPHKSRHKTSYKTPDASDDEGCSSHGRPRSTNKPSSPRPRRSIKTPKRFNPNLKK